MLPRPPSWILMVRQRKEGKGGGMGGEGGGTGRDRNERKGGKKGKEGGGTAPSTTKKLVTGLRRL